MRPRNYTNFDPEADFMFAVNRQREREIESQLSLPGARNRDDLLTEKLLCRFRDRVLPQHFTSELERFSEAACDQIHKQVVKMDEARLNGLQVEVNKTAWQLHVNQGCPQWLANMSRGFLPQKDRRLFLRNIAVVYFATMQKYIVTRKSEISAPLKVLF